MGLILFMVSAQAQSGHPVTGIVIDANSSLPLIGAVVKLQNQPAAVLTDDRGRFQFSWPEGDSSILLLTSYVGYRTDTMFVRVPSAPGEPVEVNIRLFPSINLAEAEIRAKRQSTEFSTLQTRGVEVLSEGELLKAACCNLSESFETNPSVDVNYNDAVTGVREIQLLGLSGIYSQMLGEAIPTLRGLANAYGLLYVPGAWIESIQISKGAGSVANGYEGITGQINIEYKKPLEEQPVLNLNAYADAFGRGEVNAIFTRPRSEKWNYMLMGHASGLKNKWDGNRDGFIDMPLYTQVNVYNRLHFNIRNRYEGQLGLKGLVEDRSGGQMDFVEGRDKLTRNAYGFRVNTRRVEAYSKTGIIFPETPFKSAGLQMSAIVHDQKAYFGLRTYNALQTSAYANLIYMGIVSTTEHKFKTGADFRFDRFNENVDDSSFIRTEAVPGAYIEYSFGCDGNPFGLIAGMRADYHNLFGWLYTPRVNLKYNFTPNLIIRVAAGRGYRMPNTYADNMGLFISAKALLVLETPRLEDAWNGGVNLTARFRLWERDGSFVLDAYSTRFNNQWVSDQFSNDTVVYYYNLKGRSFANSLQATVQYELMDGLSVKAAWKLDDVRADYLAFENLAKPLVARNKALFNAAYSTNNNKWRFDATLQFEGVKPLQQLAGEGVADAENLDDAPSFTLLMAQVTRVFKKWEAYAGGENLLDYRQEKVIWGSDNPFENKFDATQVWGPVMGRRLYIGIRYSLY